jgi:UPF0148 protein
MDEDEVLEKITRLLERGCTMLATHHDCGAPLFRCHGEVVCPVCSFKDGESSSQARAQPAMQSEQSGHQEITLGEEPSRAEQRGTSRSSLPSVAGSAPQNDLQNDIGQVEDNLRAALLRKLAALTKGLEEEQDLDKLKKQLDCVEGLLKVFRSLRKS